MTTDHNILMQQIHRKQNSKPDIESLTFVNVLSCAVKICYHFVVSKQRMLLVWIQYAMNIGEFRNIHFMKILSSVWCEDLKCFNMSFWTEIMSNLYSEMEVQYTDWIQKVSSSNWMESERNNYWEPHLIIE